MMAIAPSDVAAKVNFAFVDIVKMEADGRSKFGLCGKSECWRVAYRAEGALGPHDLAAIINIHLLSASNHRISSSCRHIIYNSPWHVVLTRTCLHSPIHMLTSVPVCTKLGWYPNVARRTLNPPTSVNTPTHPYPQAEREAQKIVQQGKLRHSVCFPHAY